MSLFENEHQVLTAFFNSQHPNFKFTIEKEQIKQLPFLHVLITCLGVKYICLQKSTSTAEAYLEPSGRH